MRMVFGAGNLAVVGGMAMQITALSAHLHNGTYTGVHSEQFDQDFFLGLPYAQAPVNELRFRAPESLNTSWDGSRDATAYAPSCIGYGSDGLDPVDAVSEDCLYLNVVRPSRLPLQQRVPVAGKAKLLHADLSKAVLIRSRPQYGFTEEIMRREGLVMHDTTCLSSSISQ